MIYEQPNHCLTLDRFMVTYEKKYSRRLPHFYGHPKLLKLLEDFPDTLEVRLSTWVLVTFILVNLGQVPH